MNHAQHVTRHGRRRFAAACLVAGAFGARAARPAIAASASRDPDGALLARVIEGAHRRPEARSRDAARHPFETLRFFGIRPDMTVVEIAPGAGWYTEILAPYLREHGRLYAAHYARDAGSDYQRRSRERFDAKLAADPALYDRVVVGEQPDPGHGFRGIAPPGGADMVLTFRNLHNWMKAGHLDQTLRAFRDVLRPGGALGITEHRAAPGTSIGAMIETGYVTEAFVIERLRAAGFKLEASSGINANPKDTRDHPHGVWSLPPSLRGKEVDRERFLAIGESDRMTLRFRRA
jgi:predicted methyltransferase